MSQVSSKLIGMLAMLAIALPLGIGHGHDALASDAARREDKIKAAYIYNFIKFVSWPQSHPGDEVDPDLVREDLNVCAYGDKPLRGALSGIDGKTIGERKVTVFSDNPDPESVRCDVAFFSDLSRNAEAFAFGQFSKGSVLTISDELGFFERGGIIEFVYARGKLGFKINKSAAEEADLAVGTKLLLLSEDRRR